MNESNGARARNRAQREAEILRLGREQLTTRGPAALSLREIARDLGVASSAVYRYVADRDALLTLLVVDAYTELADAVTDEVEPCRTLRTSLVVFAQAMRRWAKENPARWGLIYGTPVPGYAAQGEFTSGPGTRLMRLLVTIVAEVPTPGVEPAGLLRTYLENGAEDLGVAADAPHMGAAVEAWCAIVGTISTEVFGQLGPEVAEVGEALLQRTAEGICERMGTRH